MNLPSITVSIAADTSKSGVAHLGGADLIGIITPAAWTAAVITFEASIDGEEYHVLGDRYDNVLSVAVTPGRHIDLEVGMFLSTPYLKIVSGVPGELVNQEAERTIKLIVRKLS